MTYLAAITILEMVMLGRLRSDDPEAVTAARYLAEGGWVSRLGTPFDRCAFDIIAEAHGLTHAGEESEPDASSDEDYPEGTWPI